MSNFSNKVVLVTGGSSGIGKAVAVELLTKGAKVIIASRKEDGLEEYLAKYPDNLLFVKTDVTQEDQVINLIDTIEEKYGRLDAAFNNAGVFKLTPICEITAEIFHQVVDTNALGVLLCMKHEILLMKKQIPQGGVILNNASAIRKVTMPGSSIYGGSKAMIQYLGKVAATEHIKDHIWINSISPGYFRTELIFKAAENVEVAQKIEVMITASMPNKQLGQLYQLVSGALYLLSDTSFVNGTDLVIDGGLSTLCGREF